MHVVSLAGDNFRRCEGFPLSKAKDVMSEIDEWNTGSRLVFGIDTMSLLYVERVNDFLP